MLFAVVDLDSDTMDVQVNLQQFDVDNIVNK